MIYGRTKKELFEILKKKDLNLSQREMIHVEVILDQIYDSGYEDAMIAYGLKDREDD